jgi:hypothetical protein
MSKVPSRPVSPSHSPTVSTAVLPRAESATFHDSSFFSRNGPGARLPLPADVRRKSPARQPSIQLCISTFKPVRYEELGLVVKYGRAPDVTVAEGQCLWALRRVLPNVPVPEVYGWIHDGGQVFIYMELVQGATLEERWDSLDRADRTGICQQLRALLSELRKLRHAPGEFFLGKQF